jgi:hypothetical protein
VLLVRSPPDVPSMIFACVLRLPRDDRMIYYCLLTTEADIWLMTLE